MAKSKIQSALAESFDGVDSRGDGAYYLKKSGIRFLYRPYRVLSPLEQRERGRVDQLRVGRRVRDGFTYIISEASSLDETIQPVGAWIRKFQKWAPEKELEALPPGVADIARGVFVDLFCLLRDPEKPRSRPKAPSLDPGGPAIQIDFRDIAVRFELNSEYGVAAFIEEKRSTVKATHRVRRGRAMVAKGTSSLVVAEGLIAAGKIEPRAVLEKWRS